MRGDPLSSQAMKRDSLDVEAVSPYHDHVIAADVLEPGSRWWSEDRDGNAIRRENAPLIAWHLDCRAHSNGLEALNPEVAGSINENTTNRGPICRKELWRKVLRERIQRRGRREINAIASPRTLSTSVAVSGSLREGHRNSPRALCVLCGSMCPRRYGARVPISNRIGLTTGTWSIHVVTGLTL